jgi:hypothetical protein
MTKLIRALTGIVPVLLTSPDRVCTFPLDSFRWWIAESTLDLMKAAEPMGIPFAFPLWGDRKSSLPPPGPILPLKRIVFSNVPTTRWGNEAISSIVEPAALIENSMLKRVAPVVLVMLVIPPRMA